MMRREAEYFFAALRFFTRLPVPRWVGHSAAQLNHAARYFPLIGVLVGAIGGGVTLLALALWPATVAVPLGMAATLLATGAFHEDGLADSCDGFGGGWSREDVLRIMKDSRIGSYGTIGIVLALLLKAALLVELAEAPAAVFLAALIAGHSVSRLASTALIFTLDYARDDDGAKAKPLAVRMGRGELAFAAATALLACLPLLALQPPQPAALRLSLALTLVAIVALLAARHFVRRLGGYTGDCLGATQQLTEIAFYLGLACAFFS